MNFIRHCLGRVNPVLAPRRKRETAERHLRAIRIVSRWLDGMMPTNGDAVRQWTAGIVLDAGSVSRNTCPPGFGSADWDAKDGVLKHTLRLAAEYTLHAASGYKTSRDYESPYADTAWRLLWPEIWAVCDGYAMPTQEEWSAAVRTMELIDPLGPLYFLQVHGTVDEVKALAEYLGWGIPGPEGYFERGAESITRGEDNDCVITIVREAPIPVDIMVRIKGIDHNSGSAYTHVAPLIAPHVHVDTMAAGFEHQPQYRGTVSGLAAALPPSNGRY